MATKKVRLADETEPAEGRPLPETAAAIVGAVVHKVKGDNVHQASERITICTSDKCGVYHKGSGTCGICKCFLALKVHNPNEHCPVNLW